MAAKTDSVISQKLERFFNNYNTLTFNAGETILRPDEKISRIYFVKSGNIKQFVNSPDGERLTVQIFKQYSFIPLVLFLSGKNNKYYFQAINATEVRSAPVEDVIAFIKENPDVLFDLTTRLSQAVAGLLQKIELNTFDNSYSRVLSMLIHLGVKYGEKRGEEYKISLLLSHSDIASMLGLRRETVSRKLALLRKNGIIRYDKENIVIIKLT